MIDTNDAYAMPDPTRPFEPTPRRVRVRFDGMTIADSTRAMLLRERASLPAYYFPVEDVRTDHLIAAAPQANADGKGTKLRWDVTVGERTARLAAWGYQDPTPGAPDLTGHVTFLWKAMDGWFEEDEEVFVHARDPYKRIDVLRSSRHVRVVLDGVALADTTRPSLLFETGLPTRYYIPRADVREDLLVASDTRTACPYKGEARYLSVVLGERVVPDLVWFYPYPIPECPKIEGLFCFFNEKVDIVENGIALPRPRTRWS